MVARLRSSHLYPATFPAEVSILRRKAWHQGVTLHYSVQVTLAFFASSHFLQGLLLNGVLSRCDMMVQSDLNVTARCL
jgi:hypothetical protein